MDTTEKKRQAALQYASIMDPLNLRKNQGRYQYYGQYDFDEEPIEESPPEHKEYKPKPKKLQKHLSLDYELADLEGLGLTQVSTSSTRSKSPHRSHITSRIHHMEYPHPEQDPFYSASSADPYGDYYAGCQYGGQFSGLGYGYGTMGQSSRKEQDPARIRPNLPRNSPGKGPIRVLSVTPEVEEPSENLSFLQAEDPHGKKRRSKLLCF